MVLDVRNAYEWDAGHFQGAERPVEEEFRETPVDAEPPHLAGVPRDAPVMMYCTGGIRCDVYSAALRKQGFTNLYTLEGGIANYLRTEGGDLWDGSLFVFDSRNVLPGDLTAGTPPNLRSNKAARRRQRQFPFSRTILSTLCCRLRYYKLSWPP